MRGLESDQAFYELAEEGIVEFTQTSKERFQVQVYPNDYILHNKINFINSV
jgi:hypothetical protein